jgi:hypothetical protein
MDTISSDINQGTCRVCYPLTMFLGVLDYKIDINEIFWSNLELYIDYYY